MKALKLPKAPFELEDLSKEHLIVLIRHVLWSRVRPLPQREIAGAIWEYEVDRLRKIGDEIVARESKDRAEFFENQKDFDAYLANSKLVDAFYDEHLGSRKLAGVSTETVGESYE